MRLTSSLLGLAFFPLFLGLSCAGMKVLKEPPPREESKPGVTWGPGIGKVEVKKVGFWCDSRSGALTFGAFGPTEPEARENSLSTCRKFKKDGPCDIASCKPVDS